MTSGARHRPDPGDAWNLRPVLPPGTPPPAPPADRPPPQLLIVDNAGDDVAAARHLASLGRPPAGRVVVRPTPGALDVLTLGVDLLVAIGKHPHAARDERCSAFSWKLGTAWLQGTGARDVVVDRAHLLSADQLTELAGATAGIGANLWLLWSTPTNPFHDHAVAVARGLFGDRTQMLDLWEFQRRLPPPELPQLATGHPDPAAWPVLPAADFTTFWPRAAAGSHAPISRRSRRCSTTPPSLHRSRSGSLSGHCPAIGTDVANDVPDFVPVREEATLAHVSQRTATNPVRGRAAGDGTR